MYAETRSQSPIVDVEMLSPCMIDSLLPPQQPPLNRASSTAQVLSPIDFFDINLEPVVIDPVEPLHTHQKHLIGVCAKMALCSPIGVCHNCGILLFKDDLEWVDGDVNTDPYHSDVVFGTEFRFHVLTKNRKVGGVPRPFVSSCIHCKDKPFRPLPAHHGERFLMKSWR